MVGLREWEDEEPLERCEACGGYMREKAHSCPHCGHRYRTGHNWTSIVGLSIALTVTLAVLAFRLMHYWAEG